VIGGETEYVVKVAVEGGPQAQQAISGVDKAAKSAGDSGRSAGLSYKGLAVALVGTIAAAKAVNIAFHGASAALRESIKHSEAAQAALRGIEKTTNAAYKTLGDSLAPALQAVSRGLKDLANAPAAQAALRQIGNLGNNAALAFAALIERANKLINQVDWGKLLRVASQISRVATFGIVDPSAAFNRRVNVSPTQRFSAGAEDMDAWARKQKAAWDLEGKAAEENRKLIEKQREERERLLDQLGDLLDKLDPIREATRKYAQDSIFLADALAKGAISADVYADAMGRALDRMNQAKARAILGDRGKIDLVDTLGANIERALGEKIDWKAVFQSADVGLDYFGARVQNAFTQAGEGFLQSWGGAVGNAVYAAFNGGDVVDAFVETLKQGLAYTLSQLFADLAVAFGRKLAEQTAANTAIGGGGGGGGLGGMGGGWWSAFKGWASSTAGAATLAVAATAAVLIVSNKFKQDRENRRRYQGQADISLLGGGFNISTAGAKSESHRKVAEGVANVLAAFQDATGLFMTEMQSISLQVRNSGGMVKASVGGVFLGEFLSMSDAIVAAAKNAFLTSDVAGQLDPIVKQAIQGYAGSAEEFGASIQWVQQIVNEANRFTEIEQALQGLPQLIEQTREKLVTFGVDAASAMATASKWGLAQFENAWRSISGQQLSPKEEMKQKEAQRQLLLAQLKLWQLELQSRAKYLQGQLKFAGIQGRTFQLEVETFKGYLGGRRQLVQAEASLLQAELDIIAQTLKAIDDLIATVSVGKIRLSRGGGGSLRGGFGGSSFESRDDGASLMTGPLSPLSPERQMAFARQYLDQQIASKGDVAGARQQFLESAQRMYGNTAAYAAIFEDVMRKTTDFGSFFDQQQSAQQKATSNLLMFSSATHKATKAMAAISGSSVSSFTSGTSGGGSSVSSISSASFASSLSSGGSGSLVGSGGLVGAITSTGQQTAGLLEEVVTAIRRQPTTTTTTTAAPAPVPPPPPTGTTTVYGGGVNIDRSGLRVA